MHLAKVSSAPLSPVLSSSSADRHHGPTTGSEDTDVERILQLQSAIKSLSTTTSSRSILPVGAIKLILENVQLERQTRGDEDSSDGAGHPESEHGLEWLLVGKATAQVHGVVLNTLLEQTIPLSSDVWYWDEVLASYANTGLYSVQTSPWRFWKWAVSIFQESRQRLQNSLSSSEDAGKYEISLSTHWRQFYGLVKDTVRDRSLSHLRTRAISPLTECRDEIRRNRSRLKRFREMSASGLGVLMDEGLIFDIDEDGSLTSKARSEEGMNDWRIHLSKSVVLLETILANVTVLELGSSDFENAVFTSVEEDQDFAQQSPEDGPNLSKCLVLAARFNECWKRAYRNKLLLLRSSLHCMGDHLVWSGIGCQRRLYFYLQVPYSKFSSIEKQKS